MESVERECGRCKNTGVGDEAGGDAVGTEEAFWGVDAMARCGAGGAEADEVDAWGSIAVGDASAVCGLGAVAACYSNFESPAALNAKIADQSDSLSACNGFHKLA